MSSGMRRRRGDDGAPDLAASGSGPTGSGPASSAPVVGRSGGAAGSADRAVTIGTYLVLFLLGVALAMLGAFFYGTEPIPLAALGFDVAIFCACLFGGWGMRRPAGGLAPAAGWFLTAFLLANGTSGGSVLITATTAGTWFLFGGAASAAVGLVAAFVVWSRGSP